MAEEIKGMGVPRGGDEPVAPRSKRDAVGARLKAKYPDKEYADDEAMWGQVDEDYSSMEGELGEYRDREDKLMDMFERDPRSASFLTDMARGKDPWIGVIERLGIDGITDLLNNPEKQEEYAEANKKYIESMAKNKKLEDEVTDNLKKSLDALDEMQEREGLDGAQVDAAWEWLMKVTDEAVRGVFSEDTVKTVMKALGYDSAVAKAKATGEIAGRNKKIEAQLRKPQKSDGTARLGGMPGEAGGLKKRKSMFEKVKDAQF